MKKILLGFFVVITTLVTAQAPLNAPWMQSLNLQKNGAELTFQEIVDAGNAYFETHDKNAKGSGYKPFMRWIETARQYVKDDGTLQNNADLSAILHGNLAKGVTADDSNWYPQGPYNVIGSGSWSTGQGRVNAIAVDPNNANTYYIGAPGGGVFKTTNAGATWTPLTDFIDRVGASAIAIDPNNSNIVYVGTGDDDGGDSPSIGMLKSTDGGATFSPTGLTFSSGSDEITEIYINPLNTQELYIATNRGFYKSTNGGTNVSLTFNGDVKDIKLKPGDPSTVYLVTGSQFHKSTNSGLTFTRILNGIPTGIGRMVLAVTPANADYVYILAITNSAALSGVYRSVNSGNVFTKRDNGVDILENTQGFYDLAMEVSPTNAEIVYTGCLNVWRSSNGGTSFTKINSWSSPDSASYTHADIHQIRAFGNELFVASDGGIYRGTTSGTNFTDLTSDAQIGQFYRIAVSNQSSNDLAGGLQDNGGQSLSNNSWKNFYGADGMETAIDPNNPNLRYGFIQFGGSLYVSLDGGNSLAGSIRGPESGNWITPLKMDSKGTIYAGYSSLYKIVGNSFNSVSSAFLGTIDFIEIDPANDDIIYIAVDNTLYRSTDAGVNFNVITTFPRSITAIEVNNNDNSIIYVATSFSTGKVYRSSNSGLTFTDITVNFPNLSKNCIAHLPLSADNTIFVGTSVGVYRYTDTTGQWEIFSNNMPNVSVRDLEINTQDNIITAATYGRGIWQSAVTLAAPNNDIGLVSLQSTSGLLACGDTSIDVVVKNNGLNPINNVFLSVSIDGGAATTQNITTNIASGAQTVLNLNNLSLTPGEHTIRITTIIPSDAFVSNNEDTITILKNESSVANDVYGFENRSLIVNNEGGGIPVWERGVPSGSLLNQAPAGVNVYATNLSGNYPDNTIAYLYSGCYDLSTIANPVVAFDMAFDLELNWDLIYMQYSLDSGTTWLTLGDATSANWYNSNRSPNGTNCFNCIGSQWTGTDAVSKRYSYPLGGLVNATTIVFRFVLHTDQSVTREGAIIDNFVVTGTLSNNSAVLDSLFTVYPNPSTGIFTLSWSGVQQLDYAVYDLTGKQVIGNVKVNQTDHKLDLSNVAKGMYFLNIKTQDGTVTKKLLVE